jgi:hypothetical protein
MKAPTDKVTYPGFVCDAGGQPVVGKKSTPRHRNPEDHPGLPILHGPEHKDS